MKDSKYLEIPWSIEDTIENLNEIKEILKSKLVNANMDGKAESDVKELEFDFDRAIQALEEVEQYRAIGTVEEFKALKEKAESKKPIETQPTNKLANGYSACPVCGAVVGIDDINGDYCHKCGQRLKRKENEHDG